MVSDQMRLFKRRSTLINPMALIEQHSLRLRIASEHFYLRHQTSPQIVSGHSISKSPLCSTIDSCALSIVEGQLPECSTRDLNTKSCSAKNRIYSQRKDNSLQTDCKGKLNSSGELQRQQQSSSVQADQGCWHTCLETDSKWFEPGKRENVKIKKHSQAFGLDKITTLKRYSYSK